MTKRVVRPDIQFLRMVAVLMVTLFHFWPSRLPGGFAGVDVFFVISGYLISSSLVRSVQSESGLGLAKFWSGRVRRLLPAAILVSTVAFIALFVLVNPAQRISSIQHFVPSFLYYENIQLQFDSVDYFADPNPSIYQHYWSLSVEEQFYLIWPIVLLLAWRAFKSVGKLRVVIVVATVISFSYGLYLTFTNPAAAYFNSFSRAWEFGVGAILATVQFKRELRFGKTISIAGLALIGSSTLLIDQSSHFPGYLALVPALGTALVILASAKGWLKTAYSWRPFQFLGDISYSLYLWHWPVVVILTYWLAKHPGNVQLAGALAVAVLLSWLTKRFIEDPIRFSRKLSAGKPSLTFKWLSASLVAIIAVAVLGGGYNSGVIAERQRDLQKQLTDNAAYCLGAESLQNLGRSCQPVPEKLRIPSDYQLVSQIFPEIQDLKCRADTFEKVVRVCGFGNKNSPIEIALVGDSHAAPWFSAIRSVALKNNWHLVTYYKSACALAPGHRTDTAPGKAASCEWWNHQVMKKLASSKTDIVIVGYAEGTLNLVQNPGETRLQTQTSSLNKMLGGLEASGKTVIAIRDTPVPGFKLAACLTQHRQNPSDCNLKASEVLKSSDAMELATHSHPKVILADFTDYFCVEQICPALIGGIYPYRDDDHVLSIYADTLTPVWSELLARAVEARTSAER